MRIEPLLTPIESANFQEKGNNADKARLDISAREVWSTFERKKRKKEPVHEPSATIGERVICPPCIYHYRMDGT